MFTVAFMESELGGDGFFSGMPIFMVGFFVLIIGFILFGVISAASKGISTNSLTQQLREHAACLVSPGESDALNYVAYLKTLTRFPVEKTNLEPFRIATGILKLVQGTDLISETIKKQIEVQYLRLGILDADHLADEQPVHRHHHHH